MKLKQITSSILLETKKEEIDTLFNSLRSKKSPTDEDFNIILNKLKPRNAADCEKICFLISNKQSLQTQEIFDKTIKYFKAIIASSDISIILRKVSKLATLENYISLITKCNTNVIAESTLLDMINNNIKVKKNIYDFVEILYSKFKTSYKSYETMDDLVSAILEFAAHAPKVASHIRYDML